MHIRKAVMSDTEAMYNLIEQYAVQGQLLHRTRASMYENLQSFYVAVENTKILGVASLIILDCDLAEIRSLVVSPDSEGRGIGKALVNMIIEETRRLEIKRLISLTYQVEFFQKCDFNIVTKDTLPQKMWKDCVNCPKCESCDEIAMQINI